MQSRCCDVKAKRLHHRLCGELCNSNFHTRMCRVMLKSKSLRNLCIHMKSCVFVWFVWVLVLHSWCACTLACCSAITYSKADNNSDDNGNGGLVVCVCVWKRDRNPQDVQPHTHKNPLSNLMWFIWMRFFSIVFVFVSFVFWSKTIAPNMLFFCYANGMQWLTIAIGRW